MTNELTILHLEDNQNDVELVKEILALEGFKAKVISVDTKDGFSQALQQNKIDIILADYSLPSFDGLSALKLIRKMGLNIPFILVSAVLGEELAIEALHSGATDYILKSRMGRLIPAIKRALREVEERNRRFKLEKEINELEEMYRKIAERVRGFLKMDLSTGKYSLVDRFIEELSGYSIEEWYNSSNFIEKIVHPDFKDYYVENFNRMRDGFIPKMLEYKIIRKDGEVRWWLQFNIGAYNAKQELVSVSIVLVDNTENKETTLKYQNLFENALVGMFRTDISSGKIIEANETMAQIFGYDSVEEYKKISAKQFYPNIHAREKFLQEIQAKGKIKDYQIQLQMKNSEKIWVSISARIYPKEGYIEGVAVDITEQKRAQQELFERERELENIFEHKGTLTILIENDLTISKCNHQVKAITGYSKAEIEGKNWVDFIHPDDLSRIFSYHKDRRKLLPPHNAYQCKIKHKDGHYFDALLTASLMPDSKKIVASLIDISQRTKAERELTRDRLVFKLIAETAVQAIDLRDLCQKVLYGLVETLGFDAGNIRIYFENERLLLPMASVGSDSKAKRENSLSHVSINNMSFPLSQFLTKEIFAPDVRKDDFLKNTDICTKYQYQSFISWPICNSNQKFLGIIQLGARKKQLLLESDKDFFENISKIFATAVERRMAEDALRESERQYRNLVESLPEELGLLLIQDDKVRFASPSIFEMFKLHSIKDIIGSSWHSFFASSSQEKMAVYLESAFESNGGAKLFLKTVLRRATGEEFPGEVYATLTSFQGEPAVQLLISDYTERKKVEDAILESEERYRTLVETSPLAIFLLSLSGEILFVNKQAPRIFGACDESEFLGRQFNSLLADGQGINIQDIFSKLFAAGSISNLELSFYRKDKTIIPIELSASAIYTASGEPAAIMLMLQDISERKQVEKNRQLLANIVENSKEVVITTNEHGEILFASAAIEEVLGFSPQEIIGQKISVFSSPDREQKQMVFLKKALEFGKVTSEDFLKRKDGSLIPVLITFVAFDDKVFNERTINLIIVDTSDLVKLKESLRDKYFELETLNKVISAGYLARNMNELLDFTLTTILNSFDIDGGAIYLLDEDAAVATLKRSLGMGSFFVKHLNTMPINGRNAKALFVSGKTIYIDNFMEKSEEHKSFNIQNLIGVPFFSKQKVIGGLFLSTKSKRLFGKEELLTLEAIGREIGTAIAKMQAEEQLQASQRYLEVVFNTLNNYLFVFDQQTGLILTINKKLQEHLHFHSRELLGKPFGKILSNSSREYIKEAVKTLQEGDSRLIDVEFISREGKQFKLPMTFSRAPFPERKVIIVQS